MVQVYLPDRLYNRIVLLRKNVPGFVREVVSRELDRIEKENVLEGKKGGDGN